MKMSKIFLYKICVIIGTRVCKNILQGVNNVKADFMQVAINQN